MLSRSNLFSISRDTMFFKVQPEQISNTKGNFPFNFDKLTKTETSQDLLIITCTPRNLSISFGKKNLPSNNFTRLS